MTPSSIKSYVSLPGHRSGPQSTHFRATYQKLVLFVQYYIAVIIENRWAPPLVFYPPPLSRQRRVDGAEPDLSVILRRKPTRQDAQFVSRSTRRGEWFRRKSNRWVVNGYRPISGSAPASLCSWSYIHNESVNIYSHLIPAILFLFGEFYLWQHLRSRHLGVTDADFIAFSTFMLMAGTSLSLSVTYHTLMNHSKHVADFCLRLDMLGIMIFILGDLILWTYIVFWCEHFPRNAYWPMVSSSPYAHVCCALPRPLYLRGSLIYHG